MAAEGPRGPHNGSALPRRLAPALLVVLQFVAITAITHVVLAQDSGALAYELAGRHATGEALERLRERVAPADGLVRSYGAYLASLATLELGHSLVTGEPVTGIIARALPVSAVLVLPALLLGHAAALALAIAGARRPGGRADRGLRIAATALYSVSVLILVIGLQWLLASPQALGWLPARGWGSGGLADHARHAVLPTLTLVLLVVAVNVRFYRTLFLEQLAAPYAVFARRQGLGAGAVLRAHVWPNVRGVVATRIAYTVPPLIAGGAFVIESYFGIPGMGKVSYDALLSGDRPVAGAVLGLTAGFVLLVQVLLDRSAGGPRARVAP